MNENDNTKQQNNGVPTLWKKIIGWTLALTGAGVTVTANVEVHVQDVTPPEAREGWAGIAEASRDGLEFPELNIAGRNPKETSEGAVSKLWDATKAVNGGDHLPTFRQETGDCVSMGVANAVNYLQCVQIARGPPNKWAFRPAFQPWVYGVSRMAPDLGNGRLGSSEGSLGSWGAEAVRRYGVLAADEEGVPKYSGAVAKEWGQRNAPGKFFPIAGEFRVKSVANVTSYEKARDALANGYPVTVASDQGFMMETRTHKGHHFGVPQGQWMHQMCFVGVDDTLSCPNGSKGALYCLNSWGKSAHGEPADDAPPGGFWVDRRTADRMLSQGDSYALSVFDGFPSQELNFNVFAPAFDAKVVSVPEPEQRKEPAIQYVTNDAVKPETGNVMGIGLMVGGVLMLVRASRLAIALVLLCLMMGNNLRASDKPKFQTFEPAPISEPVIDFFAFHESKKEDVKPRSKRIIYLSADWCQACKAMKPTLERLQKIGWAVNDRPDAMVQVIEQQKHRAEFAKWKPERIPTLILIENGKEIRRHVGVTDSWGVVNLWYGRDMRP